MKRRAGDTPPATPPRENKAKYDHSPAAKPVPPPAPALYPQQDVLSDEDDAHSDDEYERLSFAIGTDIESAVDNDESVDEDSDDDATLDAETRVEELPSAPTSEERAAKILQSDLDARRIVFLHLDIEACSQHQTHTSPEYLASCRGFDLTLLDWFGAR